MTQKKTYKVLAAIQKNDNTGEWFMRVGSGYENRDGSINLYVDAVPTGGQKLKLQIRELDARELAQRDAYRAGAAASAAAAGPPGASATTRTLDVPLAGAASESLPF